MSEKIHQFINEVRQNFANLNESLLAEKTKNQELISELSSLKKQVEDLLSENEGLKNEVDELKRQKSDEVEKFNIQTSQDSMISDERIDELVKEIDYCIGQLKK